jgi:hypothetical protein
MWPSRPLATASAEQSETTTASVACRRLATEKLLNGIAYNQKMTPKIWARAMLLKL